MQNWLKLVEQDAELTRILQNFAEEFTQCGLQ